MAKQILTITRFGNPVLRRVAQRLSVEEILAVTTQELISSMFELLRSDNYGVGLAAPQVGKSLALSTIGIKPT